MTESNNTLPPVVGEVIVVEGIHDKQRVNMAVAADVIVLGGDRLGSRTMNLIRLAHKNRGVIVLTDPDGAGERIRRRIEQAVPGCKQAQLTRRQAISDGGIGVEHAAVDDVRAAILRARSADVEACVEPLFQMSDLFGAGLVGASGAASKRQALGDLLGIGYGNAKAFLGKLNTLRVSREEWDSAIERLR